jgi:ABC-type nitrate/sulfonate/bicarbonate transport system ATPase subunit
MSGFPTALRARSISRTYRNPRGPVAAVSGVDLDVPEGKFVTVVGPSACGKSTLLGILCGLDTPDSGSVEALGGAPGPLLGGVGFMPQQDLLMPWRTVAENAALGLECLGMDPRVAAEKAAAHMARFGLGGFEQAFPAQLSEGMRQRVAMLRTFLSGRRVNVLDEPFAKLDALTRASMQEWLVTYWQENRCAVLFVTHDIDEALFLSDTVHVMSPRPGRIVLSLEVDLPRPRRYSEVVTSAPFNAMKSRLLEQLGRSA